MEGLQALALIAGLKNTGGGGGGGGENNIFMAVYNETTLEEIKAAVTAFKIVKLKFEDSSLGVNVTGILDMDSYLIDGETIYFGGQIGYTISGESQYLPTTVYINSDGWTWPFAEDQSIDRPGKAIETLELPSFAKTSRLYDNYPSIKYQDGSITTRKIYEYSGNISGSQQYTNVIGDTINNISIDSNDQTTETSIQVQPKLTAGQNITIENNVISATGGGDTSTKDFTLANTLVVAAEKEGIKKAMTTGDSTEDTLVWTNGEIVWNLGSSNDLRFGYGQITCYDIATYNPTDPQIDAWMEFGFDESATTTYTAMKWKVSTANNIDTFTCTMVKSDSTEVVVSTHVITGYICHFEILTNAVNITATSASGKLHDPIHPLPHDSRLDSAFDEQGYVVVGNKRIQLRDVSNMSIKDLDTTDISHFYDGTSTYIYDFFRKDYALIDTGDLKTTSIELPLVDVLTVGQQITMGIYNMSSGTPTQLGSYTPTASDNIGILKFTAQYVVAESRFKVKWYLLDPSHTIIYQSTDAYTTEPSGIYIKLPGNIEITSFIDIYQIKNISARYTRFNSENAEVEYSPADLKRDWVWYGGDGNQYHVVRFNAGVYPSPMYLEGAPKNYYMTNGQFAFTPNRPEGETQLPLGVWTLEWQNVNMQTITGATAIVDESEKALKKVQFLRESVYGLSVLITYSDNTVQRFSQETTIDRDEWAGIKVTYEPPAGTQIPTGFNAIIVGDYAGTYEKKFPINYADVLNYGVVKIDGNTIKTNQYGQIYADVGGGSSDMFTATYGTTTYQQLLTAFGNDKFIRVIGLPGGYLGQAIFSSVEENLGFVFTYRSKFYGTVDVECFIICDENSNWSIKDAVTEEDEIYIKNDNVMVVAPNELTYEMMSDFQYNDIVIALSNLRYKYNGFANSGYNFTFHNGDGYVTNLKLTADGWESNDWEIQKKLTAGTGITIVDNTISADTTAGTAVYWATPTQTPERAHAALIQGAINSNKVVAIEDTTSGTIMYLNTKEYHGENNLWRFEFVSMVDNNDGTASMYTYVYFRSSPSETAGGTWQRAERLINYQATDYIKQLEDRIAKLEAKLN